MTLTRPAWRATLTNHTRGWSYETYQGEPFDKTAPVRLLDDWSAEWTHRDAQQWEPLDPVVTTARLGARDVDDLPPLDYDDEMSLHVVRPVESGDPIVWFHAFGGVSDLDAVADWQSGSQVSLTFADPRAAVASRTHFATDEPFWDNMGFGAVGGALPGDYSSYGPWVDPKFVEGATFADVLDLYASVTELPGWSTWRMAHRITKDELPDGAYFFGADTSYRYYSEMWPLPALTAGDGMVPVLQLVIAGGILTPSFRPQVMPDPMTVLSASAVPSPVPWKKDASNGEIAVDATGLSSPDHDEILVISGPPPSEKKTVRVSLPTLLSTVAGLELAAEHHRMLRQESNDWRTPSLTLDTNRLTDAQVDYLADGRLYPRELPYDVNRGVAPVVVVGADPQSNLTGALIIGLPVGAKFRLTGGRLLIDLNISAWQIRDADNPANIPGPTYAQIAAAFPTVDYAHIDSSLTYQDLKLATI